jgi:hypothetical protein
LKKEKIVDKKSLFIKGTFFANKVLLGFDDDVNLWLGMIFFFILEDVLHNTNSRSNLFKEGKDDTNQVRPEFDLNMSTSQFREIEHIFQTVHWKSLKFYREILDT